MVETLKTLTPPLPGQGSRHRDSPGERVVLLHGLWRSVWSMEPPARRLHQAGFETLSLPYPSFWKPLEEIVDEVIESLPPSPKKTHFVTHSMGGIVLRHLAERRPDLVTGKVVMLAPPNQGSEIIDWLEESPLGRWTLGPGGMALSTRKVRSEVPPFPDALDVTVIMGRSSSIPFFRSLLEGEHDGIVTVDSGRLPGLRRFEVVDADHTLMMADESVLELLTTCLTSPQ